MASKRKRLDIGGPMSASVPDQRPPTMTTASSSSSSTSSTINPVNGRSFSSNYHRLLTTRQTLPVYSFRSDFTAMLKSHQTMILVGETGSGQPHSHSDAHCAAPLHLRLCSPPSAPNSSLAVLWCVQARPLKFLSSVCWMAMRRVVRWSRALSRVEWPPCR